MKFPFFSLFSFCAGVAFFAAACSSDSSSNAENAEISEQTTPSGESPVTEPTSSSADVPAISSEAENPSTANSSATDMSSSRDAESSANDIASSSSGITSSGNISSESNPGKSPYLWHDEFDGDIDSEKWTFEIGTGASGWGNNEWEYYTDRKENAYIKDGILHIRANKEDYEGSKYTSARMITKGKFSFTYGTVEARIALPVGKGIWPAFWLLGQNIDAVSWPACGEIDIIETVNSENIVYGTNHWAYEGNHAEYGNNTKDYYGTSKELDITQFHTYKMVWDENVIVMYVDDFKYHEISIKESTGGTDAFHKPFFFILNVAVAGNWPGFEVDDSQFPNEMLVDYIRVTQ
ncbi:Glycosyl hydrolases family 16 [Fibrobacter sp. UWB15]|uniref:glycoside hydrolase family 16 protein n=1 Tax=unclassified Fibrobacter TaxID=2634177 RepID=UPI000918807C|nr:MULTISPECIES: glycoside hydrolase family 16 protein [unclassified Fibrobacter]PWJ64468.1 glycosyl hydrolase family 16 [Fibrobacter sp. UWB6]SHG14326.1 Glycosyl hydrolases family 16 [Fibrobacter sp. UWB8]SMG31888.1 Glycosyl hydrolases family 16 [Fibrobacter sp. UWB15]